MLLSEDSNIVEIVVLTLLRLVREMWISRWPRWIIDRLDIPLYLNCLDIFTKTILLF